MWHCSTHMALPPCFEFSCPPWPRPGFYIATSRKAKTAITWQPHGEAAGSLKLVFGIITTYTTQRPGRYFGMVVLPSGLQPEHLSTDCKTARSNTNRCVEGHRKRQPGDINADTLSHWKEWMLPTMLSSVATRCFPRRMFNLKTIPQ